MDVFYARSSLHVNDSRLEKVLDEAHHALRKGGLVAIEGKHTSDAKIMRSNPVDPESPYLVTDPYDLDHIRRAWDPEFTTAILQNVGFKVISINVLTDQTDHADPSKFIRALAIRP